MVRKLQALDSGRSLADEAADQIREQILSSRFQMGERLVEAQLARELEISRGPVREALAQLRAEGLVREEPRRGSFVVSLSEDDVRDIYDLRGALEVCAVRLMLERGVPSARRDLERVLERMDQAAARDDRAALVRCDFELHETLCRLSGNARLHATFVSQSALLRALFALEEREFFESLPEVVEDHRLLLRELFSGDASRAQEACEEHLRSAKERLMAFARAPGTSEALNGGEPS